MSGGKVQLKSLSQDQRINLIGELYSTLGLVSGRAEAKKVFGDLFTSSELIMMVRRIQVASMLLHGYNQKTVSTSLRVGKETVSKIQRQLSRDRGGYELLVQRLDKKLARVKNASSALPRNFDFTRDLNSLPLKIFFSLISGKN